MVDYNLYKMNIFSKSMLNMQRMQMLKYNNYNLLQMHFRSFGYGPKQVGSNDGYRAEKK